MYPLQTIFLKLQLLKNCDQIQKVKFQAVQSSIKGFSR